MSMTNLLFQDMSARPKLFFVFGAIPEPELATWVQQNGISVPADLFEFWVETGGCELFETETVLGPYGDPAIDGEEKVLDINQAHRLAGMGPQYLVFHQGFTLSAVRGSDGSYVTLDDQYQETAAYTDLEDWYAQLIRAEYAERYGLLP